MTAIPFRQEVYYPESDGQPMAESDSHRREMTDLIAALEDRYRNDPQVYVAGNLFLYFAEGDPRGVVCPDVFLVHGVAKRLRREKAARLAAEERIEQAAARVAAEERVRALEAELARFRQA